MAKKSSIEKNNRRRKMAKQFAAGAPSSRRSRSDKTLPMEERFAAHPQARRTAAQFLADAHPQSLRAVRASARLLPQA